MLNRFNGFQYLRIVGFNKIFIHAIFVVKDRQRLIRKKMEESLYEQIVAQVEKCQSKVLAINGVEDHVHVLISLSPVISFSDLVKQVKGSTSYWMNSHDIIPEKFSWQKGTRGFSVSQSLLGRTVAYIANQKERHKTRSF